MPVALTLPLGLERRPRRRHTRLKRLAIGVLILGAALLAAGIWLPARAEIAQRLFDRVVGRTDEGRFLAASAASDRGLPRLATLAVGDELELERPDGALRTYEVTALDVVDAARTELSPDANDDVVVLMTDWPFDGRALAGEWRYVVTAHRRF
jgi:hypothetical protein